MKRKYVKRRFKVRERLDGKKQWKEERSMTRRGRIKDINYIEDSQQERGRLDDVDDIICGVWWCRQHIMVCDDVAAWQGDVACLCGIGCLYYKSCKVKFLNYEEFNLI